MRLYIIIVLSCRLYMAHFIGLTACHSLTRLNACHLATAPTFSAFPRSERVRRRATACHDGTRATPHTTTETRTQPQSHHATRNERQPNKPNKPNKTNTNTDGKQDTTGGGTFAQGVKQKRFTGV